MYIPLETTVHLPVWLHVADIHVWTKQQYMNRSNQAVQIRLVKNNTKLTILTCVQLKIWTQSHRNWRQSHTWVKRTAEMIQVSRESAHSCHSYTGSTRLTLPSTKSMISFTFPAITDPSSSWASPWLECCYFHKVFPTSSIVVYLFAEVNPSIWLQPAGLLPRYTT